MYIVYNSHTNTHTLSQETKSIKGVMIFIFKKKPNSKKENVVIYVWKICAMSCGCEINLQRRLPGVIYQNSLPPSLSLSLQSKVSREREGGVGKKNHANCWRAAAAAAATKENFNNKRNILLNLRFAYEKVYANCARVCVCVGGGGGGGSCRRGRGTFEN